MFNTTHATFIDDVLKPSYERPVVVMFHATWCGPCKSVKPLIERLSTDLSFTLVGVDGGAERGLATSESVRSVPSILVYRSGMQTGIQLCGAQTEANLRDFLYKQGVTQNTLEF